MSIRSTLVASFFFFQAEDGIRDQILVVQRELALEQPVVHLPEPALRSRRFGRLGRALRMGMALAQREVAEHEAQLVPHAPLNGFHDRVGAPAMRTFVVTVLDERDRRVAPTPDVVPFADWERQMPAGPAFRHVAVLCGASASSACRIPSAPGLTLSGDT